MPKEIAKFIGLPDAESYTGHNFKRTSATLLANSGADLLALKATWWVALQSSGRIVCRRLYTK